MSDKVSLPILAGGKFTGRALTHINELAESKVSALETKAFEAIDRKADQSTFDTFLNTVTNQISDSEARTALAGVQAAVGAERSAREEADNRLAGRVTALEEAEPDLSGYATKEELAKVGGIELVSGTVALDDRRVRELMTTGPTSIGGVTLPADLAVVIRKTTGGEWQRWIAGVDLRWVPIDSPLPADNKAPSPGQLRIVELGDTYAIVEVAGASDNIGLHAQPFRFSTNDGVTWSPWQAGTYRLSGLTKSTPYKVVAEVRDTALNVSKTLALPLTTMSEAPWGVVYKDSFDYEGTVEGKPLGNGLSWQKYTSTAPQAKSGWLVPSASGTALTGAGYRSVASLPLAPQRFSASWTQTTRGFGDTFVFGFGKNSYSFNPANNAPLEPSGGYEVRVKSSSPQVLVESTRYTDGGGERSTVYSGGAGYALNKPQKIQVDYSAGILTVLVNDAQVAQVAVEYTPKAGDRVTIMTLQQPTATMDDFEIRVQA